MTHLKQHITSSRGYLHLHFWTSSNYGWWFNFDVYMRRLSMNSNSDQQSTLVWCGSDLQINILPIWLDLRSFPLDITGINSFLSTVSLAAIRIASCGELSWGGQSLPEHQHQSKGMKEKLIKVSPNPNFYQLASMFLPITSHQTLSNVINTCWALDWMGCRWN